MIFRGLPFAIVCTALPVLGGAQEAGRVTELLGQLKSRDIEARHKAMFELQTSLDPRIPDACLPVLELEGDSIRRLAARAIGSRWHQIPRERLAVFAGALQSQLKSEHDGLVNMARRGLALLNRDYRDAMVSRSRNGRWVIYERHGLPCLIDTQNETEELLGYVGGDDVYASFSPAWGNSEVAPATCWHSRKELVALDILLGRKTSEVWVWRHGPGLRKLTMDEMVKALGVRENEFHGAGGFFVQIVGWKGDQLEFTVSYMIMKGDDFIDREATFRWDSARNALRVVSNQTVN